VVVDRRLGPQAGLHGVRIQRGRRREEVEGIGAHVPRSHIGGISIPSARVHGRPDMENPVARESRRFPAAPASVSDARHLVETWLRRLETVEETVEIAMLLTSELAGNAVLHGGGEIELTMLTSVDTLRIEVRDSSARLPRLRQPELYDASGRGLHIVDALAARWGTEPDAGAKVVWFELALEDGRVDTVRG
jgi:anti-sigma regulatory factor (Ser/Thr protein kinase)